MTATYERCLQPLLSAMGWRGNARTLWDAYPYQTQITTADLFCTVLQHLGYTCLEWQGSLEEFNTNLLPALFVSQTQEVMLLLERDEEGVRVFDPQTEQEVVKDYALLAAVSGDFYVFKPPLEKPKPERWFRDFYRQRKALVWSVIGLSLILNVSMLWMSLLMRTVMQSVFNIRSFTMLFALCIGGALAVLLLCGVQWLRSQQSMVLATQLGEVLSDKVFGRLLHLPFHDINRSGGAGVLAQWRHLDRVRAFLSERWLQGLLDVPFVVVALVLMALVSGSLVIIPIILAVIFLGLTFLFLRRLRLGAEEYGNDTMPRNTFLLEMILQLRSLQYLNLRNLWCARYRESSAEQVCARLRTARLLGIEAALSDFLMAAGGMFLMTFAALRIMDGTLQGGDLFVLVLLLWRVITPLRMLLSATSQWQQLFYHLQHVKRLQKLPNETVSFHKDQLVVKNVEVLSVQNLTFRYPDALLPALSNISFTIPAGSLVGVAGQSNAGKSTLCRLLLGLYAPQVGSIFVGEQDVRQFSEMHLRQLIAYVGEVPEIFEGTVADNLRLTAPWASDSELQEAATQMACWEMITALPAGLQAPLTPTYFDTFSGSFLQRLCLTRAYLQKAPFLILDMAISQLDGHGERAFLQVLQRLRGNTTVFIVTHRRPQLALMDWILVFDAGKLVRQGPASEIVPSTAQRPKESA